MKIKIDEKGCLWIERAGKFKLQGCPRNNEGMTCGDWCPLFGEPDDIGLRHLGNPCEKLKICCGMKLVGTIIDERKCEDEK